MKKTQSILFFRSYHEDVGRDCVPRLDPEKLGNASWPSRQHSEKSRTRRKLLMANRYESESDRMHERGRGGNDREPETRWEDRSRYEGWGGDRGRESWQSGSSEGYRGDQEYQGRGERYNQGGYQTERYGQGSPGQSGYGGYQTGSEGRGGDWSNQSYRGRETHQSQWGTQGGSQSSGGGMWGQGSYASRGMENYGPSREGGYGGYSGSSYGGGSGSYGQSSGSYGSGNYGNTGYGQGSSGFASYRGSEGSFGSSQGGYGGGYGGYSQQGSQGPGSYGSQYYNERGERGGPATREREGSLGGYYGSSYGSGIGGYAGGYGNYGGGMGSYMGQGAMPGRHAGRGPRGWQRSDDRIKEDINERLTQHPDIDASDIDVQVHNAEVTLTGKVDERRAKRLAEDVAESVSGVRQVHNQLRVESVEQQGPVTTLGLSGSTSGLEGSSKKK